MKSTKYFKTTNFILVTFLFSKGQQIVGISPADGYGKKEFAFVRNPRLEELVDIFKFGDRRDTKLLVSVHSYEQARRELLDILKETANHA